MIFSNDVFLSAIQTRTKSMLKNIDAYKSRIEQCNADLVRITEFSASMFGEPPGPLRSDKDSIHFFIKLVKMKLLNELVLANIKFSSDLQDFVYQNTTKLRTLFNYLELLTFNDDLSDNAEKCRLIFDLKYDLRSMDVELEGFEQYFAKLREILVQTHQKLAEFVSCYFGKQRRERITLLDLRDGKIKTIKTQLAHLKKSDANREFREQIQELEDELLRKCNEIVEKTDMIELILADENESLYYGFHLLNDLSATLDEIQVKSLNLKTTIEIVESSDPIEEESDGPERNELAKNDEPADRRPSSGSSNACSNQPVPSQGDNLLSYDQTGHNNWANIWSPPEDSCILFDGSLRNALTNVLHTAGTFDRLYTNFDIDRPSSSLGSSTDISFINEQLNGSVSGGSSPSESLCSSFGRSLKSTNNTSGRLSVPVWPPNKPAQSLSKSVNSYHMPPQHYNPPQLYNPPNGLPNGLPNGMPIRHGPLPTPVFRSTNGPLSQSTNSHLAGKLNQPFNQPFANQFPVNGQPRISYAKSLTIRPVNPKPSQHPQQHPQHPQQHPQHHHQYRQQQPFRNLSNWAANRSTLANQLNSEAKNRRPLANAVKSQFNSKFLVSNSTINSAPSSASNSTSIPADRTNKFAVSSDAAQSKPAECPSDQQKESVAQPPAEASAKSKTKCGRKQRMANRDKKLSTLSCEHRQAGSAAKEASIFSKVKDASHAIQVEELILPNLNPQPNQPASSVKSFASMTTDSTSATSLAA